MKQNRLGNSPDEYEQTNCGRRRLFQGSLRYFKERVKIVTDLGVEPPRINPCCVHLNTPEKQAFRWSLHNLSLEAINSVQKCGHGEMSKGRMNRKQDKTNKQTKCQTDFKLDMVLGFSIPLIGQFRIES